MNKLNRYVNVPLIVVAIVFGVVFFARPQRQASAADLQFNLNSSGAAVGISSSGNGSYAYYATQVYNPASAAISGAAATSPAASAATLCSPLPAATAAAAAAPPGAAASAASSGSPSPSVRAASLRVLLTPADLRQPTCACRR